jgi:hypothetical protein
MATPLARTLWSQIVNLVSTGQNVSDSLDTAFTNIDLAITQVDANTDAIAELNASHTELITATSLAASQQPTVVDSPIQVEFGAFQTTDDVDLSALGAITFKTAGEYIISPFFQYGRSGSTGTSFLLNRYLINGTQIGNSLASKVDSADTLVPWSSSIQFTASANDVLTIEVMRDSTGNNSGGLFSATPAVASWASAPSAAIQIYKIKEHSNIQ